MLKNGEVNLRVGLQDGVAREPPKAHRSHEDNGGNGPSPVRVHLAGVFSSCCFTHTRFGFSSSAFSNAARASPFRFFLRSASPDHRYASDSFGSSWIAFWKSGMALSMPPP